MVGRPKPVYTPYIPKDKSEKKEKKSKAVDWDEDELDFEIERLETERQRLLKKSEIRGIKKEMFELEHPHITSGQERAGKAVGRLARLTGGILKEGTRGIRRTRGARRIKTMGQLRPSRPRTQATGDISLTKAIALNNWSGGESDLMERDFFGVQEERELLGDRNKNLNIGSSFEQDFFGEKKELDIFGDKKKKERLI